MTSYHHRCCGSYELLTEHADATGLVRLYDKREPRLVRVANFELEAVPEGHIIVFYNKDAPGVIGNVGHALGEAKVNIAQFTLSRDRAYGEALALVNVDSPAPPELL
jgi:hypothetical protein